MNYIHCKYVPYHQMKPECRNTVDRDIQSLRQFSLICYVAFCCIHDKDLLWFSFWMSCRHQELGLLEVSVHTYVTIEFISLASYTTFQTSLLSYSLQKAPQHSIICLQEKLHTSEFIVVTKWVYSLGILHWALNGWYF